MYNGIGIATPRGTGSSGHVTKNLSHVKPDFFRNKIDSNSGKLRQKQDQPGAALQVSTGNREILDHNRKREIEVRLLDFQEFLIEQGYSDAEIEEKLVCKRIELMHVCAAQSSSRSGNVHNDSHSIAIRKQSDIIRARDAFGIRDDFVSGEAFDPEIQQQKKREHQDKRAQRTFDREVLDSASDRDSPRAGLENPQKRRHARSRSRDRNVGRHRDR